MKIRNLDQSRNMDRTIQIKVVPRQISKTPIQDIVRDFPEQIKKISRCKDRNKQAYLIKLKKQTRIAAVHQKQKLNYEVKDFFKDLDSDKFSSNDLELQIEHEKQNLEILQLRHQLESNIQNIHQDSSKKILSIQHKTEIDTQHQQINLYKGINDIVQQAGKDLEKFKNTNQEIEDEDQQQFNLIQNKIEVTKKIKKTKMKNQEANIQKQNNNSKPVTPQEKSIANHIERNKKGRVLKNSKWQNDYIQRQIDLFDQFQNEQQKQKNPQIIEENQQMN